ncbi:hypothetical protein Cni_G26093 [Canna indica]|uniref:Uncharacterized protein n=1 Tax=Canna indica TaxID=4628 RepID=A0AAQ3L1E1_9LILI|nr:hypothetical protein Cni_G26093 [Canna indica]
MIDYSCGHLVLEHLEIESKKKQLQKAKHKKLKFLAEVKFLQRKYRDLSKNPSGIAHYGLKKRLEGIPFQLIDNVQYSNLAIQKVASIVGEDSDPSTSKIIDLNQNAEAMEVRVTRGLLKMNCSMKEDLLDSDLKLSLSGHGQTGVNRAGDRKITWHDQVEAFRV